jgi:hypothetical protein
VQPGQPHDLGCDMARCPACGIQRLQCDAHGDDRALDARAVWTGAVPAVADDYRQRVAEALAVRFTYPVYRCDRDGENERVEHADPADRIDQTPYVMVTAGDGCRSFWTPTCAELADAIVAVRDQDAETLRSENEELRKRAELAEAEVVRLRAGESPEPAAEGIQPTPAEWIRRWNDASPDQRLARAQQILAEAGAAQRCIMADHEAAIAIERYAARARLLAESWRTAAMQHVDQPGPSQAMWAGIAHVCAQIIGALTGDRDVTDASGNPIPDAPNGVVVLRRDDLDLVMNGAGRPASWETYADACQRIRDALEGGRRA